MPRKKYKYKYIYFLVFLYLIQYIPNHINGWNIKMVEKYILIFYSGTISNNLSDDNKNNFWKLEITLKNWYQWNCIWNLIYHKFKYIINLNV